ncbi:MAG TPA: hypothetical protein VGM88_25080 [Kofleriaceae bacterium]
MGLVEPGAAAAVPEVEGLAPGKRTLTESTAPGRSPPATGGPRAQFTSGSVQDAFDPRTHAEKLADLEEALAEAEPILTRSDSLEPVAEALPAIRTRYQLKSLSLYEDERGDVGVLGEVNPRRKTKAKWQTKRKQPGSPPPSPPAAGAKPAAEVAKPAAASEPPASPSSPEAAPAVKRLRSSGAAAVADAPAADKPAADKPAPDKPAADKPAAAKPAADAPAKAAPRDAMFWSTMAQLQALPPGPVPAVLHGPLRLALEHAKQNDQLLGVLEVVVQAIEEGSSGKDAKKGAKPAAKPAAAASAAASPSASAAADDDDDDASTHVFRYPARGTGDIWHAAAFTLAHKAYGDGTKVKIVIAVNLRSKQDKAAAPGLVALMTAVGLEAETEVIRTRVKGPRRSAALARLRERVDRDIAGAADKVHDQKATTTMLMAYILKHGVEAVTQTLREGFTANATAEERVWVEARVEEIRAHVLAEREKAKDPKRQLLILNRRAGHENKQHNTTKGLADQVGGLADEHHLSVMGMATGVYQAGDIDLFDSQAAAKPANTVEKRRTALLWSRLADLQRAGYIHGVIGGRSGSMDIAAFMGMNAFSWDENKPEDENYLRLLQTHPIMSIGHVEGEGDARRLDAASVGRWMSGEYPHPFLKDPKSVKAPALESGGSQPMAALREHQSFDRSIGVEADKKRVAQLADRIEAIAKAAPVVPAAAPPPNTAQARFNQFDAADVPGGGAACSPMAVTAIARLLAANAVVAQPLIEAILLRGRDIYTGMVQQAVAAVGQMQVQAVAAGERLDVRLLLGNLRHFASDDVPVAALQAEGIRNGAAGATFADGDVAGAMANLRARFAAAGDRGVTIVVGGYTTSVTRVGAHYCYFDSHGDNLVRNAFAQRLDSLDALILRVQPAVARRVPPRDPASRAIGLQTFERLPPAAIPAPAAAAAH